VTKQALTEIVAGMAVQADSATVTVYEPDEFRRAIDSADTPARLIFASTEGDTHVWRQQSKGRAEMAWVIHDLLLYRPVEEGLGWLDVGYALDAYCDSYASLLRTTNQDKSSGFCSVSANVDKATFLVGVHTFGERAYYGVKVTLRIIQYVS
jgi:hypothetical protein